MFVINNHLWLSPICRYCANSSEQIYDRCCPFLLKQNQAFWVDLVYLYGNFNIDKNVKSISLVVQTGTWRSTVIPLHMNMVRGLWSSPWLCNTSPPLISQLLGSELWLLLSCHPQTLACCQQLLFSPPTSTRTSCVNRWRKCWKRAFRECLSLPELLDILMHYKNIIKCFFSIYIYFKSKILSKNTDNNGKTPPRWR